MRQSDDVKIKTHSGATTEDIVDHIQPVLRKNPDLIIIHSGTNDLTNDVATIKHVERIIQMVKKKSPKTKIAFSSIINRKDKKGMTEKIRTMNKRLKNVTDTHNVAFIINDTIKENELDKWKLHLNKKGNIQLQNNFINLMNRY